MKTTNGKQSRAKSLKGALIVRVDVLLVVLGGGEAALCTRKREDDGVGVGGLGMNKSRCKNSIPVKVAVAGNVRNDTEIRKSDNKFQYRNFGRN